jgi:hypothetical protein
MMMMMMKFSNWVVQVTDNETWVSMVSAEAHTFTKQAKMFKQTLSAYQRAVGNCFLGQESSVDGGIHHINARVVFAEH